MRAHRYAVSQCCLLCCCAHFCAAAPVVLSLLHTSAAVTELLFGINAAACKRNREAYAQMQAPSQPGKLVHHHASTLIRGAPQYSSTRRKRDQADASCERTSRATRTVKKIGGHRQIDTRICSVPSGRATAVWQRSARRRRRRNLIVEQGCPREPVRTPALTDIGRQRHAHRRRAAPQLPATTPPLPSARP